MGWGRNSWAGAAVALGVTLAGFLAGMVLATPARAAGPPPFLEAEEMEWSPRISKVFADSAASGQEGLNLIKNGTIPETFSGSVDRVTVRARGNRCRGVPRMVVRVDGRRVMSTRVESLGWNEYGADFEALEGAHTVTITFTNDYQEKGYCDRNLLVDKVDLEYTPPSGEDKPTCDRSLQSLVDAAGAGTVVEAPGGCVYREKVVVNKPLTLEAGPGAEIRGSDVWTGWEKVGDHWIKGKLPSFPAGYNVQCEPNTHRCYWPEQVFFDGRPLLQVAENPASGQFAVDADRNVVLADDPTGHFVEVTTRTQWVAGGADNVTVRGFTMKHAATARDLGALTNRHDGKDHFHHSWTIEDNQLSDAHGAVVALKGRDNKLLRNDISRGGQLGVHGGGDGNLLQDNKIHHNNTEEFSMSWEAGGVKSSKVKNLTVDGNEVFDNHGHGVWTDIGSENVVYSNNRAHHNSLSGLFFEISSGAKIFGNVAWENGWTRTARPWYPGISVMGSRDVEVYDNVSAWNAAGISVIRQTRSDSAPNVVENVHVHDNTIIGDDGPSLFWVQDEALKDGTRLNDPAANNRGTNNVYWYSTPEGSPSRFARFSWGTSRINDLAEFNATPGEENGRYLTAAEKSQAVSAARIPASPEPRKSNTTG